MNNQPIQLQLEFNEKKVLHVTRLGDTRERDSEGRFVGDVGDSSDTESRLREQLYVLRINSSIWLKNRDMEIEVLKQELKKYKNE